jgi:hypothetical protein
MLGLTIFLLLLAGPVVGGAIQIARGGEVIPGSVVGAVLSYWGFALAVAVCGFLLGEPPSLRPTLVIYELLALTAVGSFVGFFVGIPMWIGAAQFKVWRARSEPGGRFTGSQ